jgi:anti-anti-sigma factor
MEVTVETRDARTAVIRLTGRLDLLSATAVRQRLAETVAGGQKRLVVDLGAVPFIDSSGLGALIGGLKAARQAGGDLRIARAGDQAVAVLKLTTLDRVFGMSASVEEALAGLA